ncbi:hypothetical protein HY572_03695 [Candidatus Micrarchaeota archaeon]|nr:hypothetical protein [Candidatus Micrarchaeota archaeon]
MKNQFLMWGIFTLVAVGCLQTTTRSTPTQPPSDQVFVDFGKPFNLSPGQIASFDEGKLGAPTLEFLGVTEDSRCPSGPNIACVWEGQATVELNLALSGVYQTFNLTARAGKPEAAEKDVLGYHVILQTLEPYPETGKPVPKNQYRAILTVSKAENEPNTQPEDKRNGIYSQYCQTDSDCVLETQLNPQCAHACMDSECRPEMRLCQAYYAFSEGNRGFAQVLCKQNEACRMPNRIQCIENQCQVN